MPQPPIMSPFDPLTQLMMMGVSSDDPRVMDAIANHLAAQGYSAPLGPQQATATATTPGGEAGAGAGSTTITPPGQTVAQLTPQMRTPGDAGAGLASAPLPTGDPTATPPNTTGIVGSDGQSVQPPMPINYSASMRSQTDSPQPSPKDQTAHAGVDTSGTSQVGATDGVGPLPPGMSQSDVTDVSPDTQVAPFTGADTTAGKIGAGLTTFGKSLGALTPPQNQDLRMANAPLPQHETRFTPQDLLTLIQTLGQAGSKTQPQSLGALIGR